MREGCLSWSSVSGLCSFRDCGDLKFSDQVSLSLAGQQLILFLAELPLYGERAMAASLCFFSSW